MRDFGTYWVRWDGLSPLGRLFLTLLLKLVEVFLSCV